jgi:hypothetical protein
MSLLDEVVSLKVATDFVCREVDQLSLVIEEEVEKMRSAAAASTYATGALWTAGQLKC